MEILGTEPLAPIDPVDALKSPDTARWSFASGVEGGLEGDSNWSAALDSLRSPRKKGQNLWEWRKESPIHPVVFRDPLSLNGEVVHLHLEHRLVQRLLGRFLSQGFLYDELTRACVCYTRETIPKVIVLGRLSLYGDRATRLHTETGKKDVLRELEDALATPSLCNVPQSQQEQFKAYAATDVKELIPHLDDRATVLTERAQRELTKRGETRWKEKVRRQKGKPRVSKLRRIIQSCPLLEIFT